MEEKERYEWNSRFDEAIKDNQIGDIVNAVEVLNKQDKRIKELEEENGYILFEDGYDKDGNEIHKQVYTTYKEEFTRLVLENKRLRKENQQLKQQLAITEKALELAVEHISIYSDSCVYCDESWRKTCPCREMWGSELCYEHLKKCLIKEAKEIMKSE